jgi:hypothetical protein
MVDSDVMHRIAMRSTRRLLATSGQVRLRIRVFNWVGPVPLLDMGSLNICPSYSR